jgi:RNA 2',3'-cyclic 3'-phosphodiesterase
MRLFIALDIDESIRVRIARFMDGVREFAPNARWVPPQSLHVTLKFIGEKPAEVTTEIRRVLTSVGGESFDVSFRGFGFFPTARLARVFWVGIEARPPLTLLATAVNDATATLGIPREVHPFSPHLTLARGGGGSGSPRRQKEDRRNSNFEHLHNKLAALPAPEFGSMKVREFYLYQSQLSPGGSRYTKLERFPLDS